MNYKKLLNGVGALLLIALVVPFVIYAVPAVVGADHSFVVLSASMTPAIAPGDMVIVDDRDPATIAEGDVITFSRGTNEVPVTHRVTAVIESDDGLAFETKGDANSDPDTSLVPAENVIGTVLFSIPYIGYVVQFTNTPSGFVVLVAGPIGLFIASEIWTLHRQRSGVSADDDGADGGATTDDAVVETAEPIDGHSGNFVITVRTLEGAFVPLAALVAYGGYTAYVRLTELTVAVAVGSTLSLLALSILLVNARRQDGDAPSEPESGRPERAEADGDTARDPAEEPASIPDVGVDGTVRE